MSMNAPTQSFASLLGSLWSLAALGLAVLFIVIAFVVRGTRPDVFPILLVSAILSVVGGLLGVVVTSLSASFSQHRDMSAVEFSNMLALAGSVRAVFSLSSGLVMMFAILRLAKPPAPAGPTAFDQGRYQ